jgi:hypothetical protein
MKEFKGAASEAMRILAVASEPCPAAHSIAAKFAQCTGHAGSSSYALR